MEKENRQNLLNKNIRIKNISNLGTNSINKGFSVTTDNVLTLVFLVESFWEKKRRPVERMRANKRAISTQFYKIRNVNYLEPNSKYKNLFLVSLRWAGLSY